MAIEIPIYVDIKGALNAAAKQVPSSIKDLQSVISENALKLKFDVAGGRQMALQEMLLGPNTSMRDLQQGLVSIKKEFDAISKAAAQNAKADPGLQKTKALANAYALVEQRITGVSNSTRAAAMMAEYNITKIRTKIEALKQDLAKTPVGSEQFNKLNYELLVQQRRLADATNQHMRYKAGIDATNKSLSTQTGIFSKLTTQIASYASVFTLFRFVKQIRDVTGELEYQRVALGHLIQDVEYGNQLFGQLIEAAKESPFRIKDLVTYTKQLAAYRVEQENLFDTTMKLADISAGLGVSMDRLVLAYGQVRAASVLRGQELRQFTEAGIPLVDELAKKFRELGREGTTTADVFKLISARAVPFSMIEDIFNDLTEAGGMFYKMQEEQAKTLHGRWEKLKDAYDKALMSVGENDTFQRWNDTVLKALNGIANNLRIIIRVANAATVSWVAYKTVTAIVASDGMKLAKVFAKEYGAAGLLTVAVNGLTAAWKRLVVAVSSNWVGLALSAAAGVVTYLTTFHKKTDEATEAITEMSQALERMKIANEELDYGQQLVGRYVELAEQARETAEGNEKLQKVMKELSELYPELEGKIDAENQSLEEQKEILNGVVKAKHELAVQEAKEQLSTQEDIIRGLKDEKKAQYEVLQAARYKLKVAQAEERANLAGLRSVYNDDEIEKHMTYQNKLKEITIEAAKNAKEAEAAYNEVSIQLSDAEKQAENLRNLISPPDKTDGWQPWAKEVKKLQDAMLELGGTPVFDNEELRNFTLISDMADKLKKKIEDLTESLAAMKFMYSAMADKDSEAAKALSSEIEETQRTLDIAEAMRKSLGLAFTKSKSDNRLSNLKNEISEATGAYKKYVELLKYMSKESALREIGILYPKLEGDEPTFKSTVDKLQTMLDGVQQKLRKSPKDKVLLDMQHALETEISNLKFDKIKEDFQNSLKRLSEEIKHSEASRNFFDEILGITGDRELATHITMSVYGETGDDFAKRVQEELRGSLESIDPNLIDETLMKRLLGDADSLNWDDLFANIDKLPEEVQSAIKKLKGDTEKYNADYVKDLLKTYEKTKTFEERITDIRQREAEARKKILQNSDLPEAEKSRMISASQLKEQQDVAEVQVEALKSTDEWVKAFEDLDKVGTTTLQNLIGLIEDLIETNGSNMNAGTLRALTKSLEQAREQVYQRNPFSGFAEGMWEYIDALGGLVRARRALKQEEDPEVSAKLADAEDGYRKAIEKMKSSTEGLSKTMGDLNEIVSLLSDAFDFDDLSAGKAILDGISQGIATVVVGLNMANAVLTLMEANPIVLAISAAIAAVASLGKIISNLKMNRINREIEVQKDVVSDLEKEYNRLEKAISSAFGSDYIKNYNRELENLYAQQAAYEEQARLERSKGKKADEEAIKGYMESAEDTAEKISEMQGQLAEHFSGTDVASAARDFAQSWIDAYRSFASTTQAMRENFREFVDNMVVESLAGRVIQQILDPIFKEIDDYAKGGELTEQEISEIAAHTETATAQINNAMTGLMQRLTAAGLNMRGANAGMSGISREIAGASEQSINALAAGINTQNYYMSFMPAISANVEAILLALGGAVTANASPMGMSAETATFGDEVFRTRMENIDSNIYDIMTMLRSVITGKMSETNTHVIASK